MTLGSAWALQQAVFARLVDQLSAAGDGGEAVKVFDHPPRKPPRYHCRIDTANVSALDTKAGGLARHGLIIHVFDRGALEGAGRGQKEVKRLIALVDQALAGWAPLSDGASLRFVSSSVDLDSDGLTHHAWARFEIILGG